MARAVRVYNQWRQGSSGSGDPATAEYNSENAQVYENGTLGPRPGWKVHASAGSALWETDDIYGLGWYRETDDGGRLVILHDDGTPRYTWGDYDTSPGTITWNASGNLANLVDTDHLNPPEYSDFNKIPVENDGFVLSFLGGYVAKATAGGIGTPTIPNTADGYPAAVTIYRERAYYWGFVSKPGRIYYSDAADYATVGATSFFDVAVDTSTLVGAVVGAWAVRNALLIARKDDHWLVLTGSSPENGSMRELGRDIVPNFLTATVVDNQLYFLHRDGQGLGLATPSIVDSETMEHLSPTAYPGSTYERPDNAFQPEVGVGDEVGHFLFLPGRPSADSTEIVAVEKANGVFNLSRWVYTDGNYPDHIEFTPGRPNEMWAIIREA